MIQYIIANENNHHGTPWFVKCYKGAHKEIEFTTIRGDAARFDSYEELSNWLSDAWWESLDSIRGRYEIKTIIN